jgi:tol-pal system protein YbgF
MRFTQSWLAVGVIVVAMTLPCNSWAKSELDLRLTRLENIVENELNIGLINQLDAMQQEIRELRGKLEEQQNSVQALNQKQDKLFVNLDTRLNSLNQAPDIDLPKSSSNFEPQPDATATLLESEAFDSAYKLMNTKKYDAAITEFKDLLWKFPEGTYAASTYYWLGEIYLLQWQQNRADQALLDQAKQSFSIVASKYKGDTKEADALLKLGMIEIDLGNWTQAKEVLTQVIQKQPNSSRARIAEGKLQRIQKQ